ncbi:MAG: Holliday junction resolvase RuvX [Actinomycetia bacterium]|nr:Holliday junction resolvase RuvX [Actinomycetes bacterium]
MKIIGMDIGEKRIGLAITDEKRKFSIPHSVLNNDRYFNQNLEKILEENNIEKIVVGMPYTLRGEIGKQGEKVISFVDRNIIGKGIEIAYMDERFTSKVPLKNSIDRKKIKEQIDKFSATLILQNYLDRMSKVKK